MNRSPLECAPHSARTENAVFEDTCGRSGDAAQFQDSAPKYRFCNLNFRTSFFSPYLTLIDILWRVRPAVYIAQGKIQIDISTKDMV
jgi:hypothetical protein